MQIFGMFHCCVLLNYEQNTAVAFVVSLLLQIRLTDIVGARIAKVDSREVHQTMHQVVTF